MAKRKLKTKVTAFMPHNVDLTKLKSDNALQIQVRRGKQLLGTLFMGRGSVEWWPSGNKINRLRKTWHQFACVLDEHM